MLWALLNFNQLVYFAPFMSLHFPSLFFLVLRPLSFSVGDLYLLTMLYDFLFSDMLHSLPSRPFSPNFQLHGNQYFTLGFSSMDILSNCGPLFLLFLLLFVMLLFYFLISCNHFNRCFCLSKVREYCSGLKWGSFIRTLL